MLKPPPRDLAIMREQEARHSDREKAKTDERRGRAIARAKRLERKRALERRRREEADAHKSTATYPSQDGWVTYSEATTASDIAEGT